MVDQTSDYFSINATTPHQALQISGASVIAPSLGIPTDGAPGDAFCLWPTLEDASQTPLTGRGCHGPSGPYYGTPGEQTLDHHIESIHLFIKVGRDCRRLLPCVPTTLSRFYRSLALCIRSLLVLTRR